MAIALVLVVRVGIPVAVLFALSYWLRQRLESEIGSSGAAPKQSSEIGHDAMPDLCNREGELTGVGKQIRLDVAGPVEMARNEEAEEIRVGGASKDVPEASTQGCGAAAEVIVPFRQGGSTTWNSCWQRSRKEDYDE